MTHSLRAAVLLAASLLFCLQAPAVAQEKFGAAATKPTIVLVHGAWADASSWDGVIVRLQRAGYPVLAPPNTLRGIASDSRYLAAFLKSIRGPIVLVAHSYGGMVISAAASGNSEVKALVFVDAYVPAPGDSVLSLTSKYPGSRLSPKAFTVVPFATPSGGDADLYISYPAYASVFASDEPTQTAMTLFATQRPFANSALTEKAPAATAWKTIPSWYLIGDNDLVIPPATQLWMAQRAKSHVTHVNAGHPSMISHPEAAFAAIVSAATATARL